MRTLLRLSSLIDGLNDRFGWLSDYFVLVAVLISAGNAAIRYLFGYSSNGFLEIQWYLFGALVLFGASQTLAHNGHVRVDVLYGIVSHRMRLYVDLFGLILFLMPASLFLAWLSWPVFVTSYVQGETSPNFGGLIRWPIVLALPLGFALLSLQGVSEIIKRVGALAGLVVIDTKYEQPLQ